MDTQTYQALHAHAAHIFEQMERDADPRLASQGSHEALRQIISRIRIAASLLKEALNQLKSCPPKMMPQIQPIKTFAYLAAWSVHTIGRALEFTKILPFKGTVVKDAKALHRELKLLMAQYEEMAYSGLEIGRQAEAYGLTHIGDSLLSYPFVAWVEPDDDGFIARCREVPQVYGFGASQDEALAMLTSELANLREDLNGSDDFPDEYLSVRKLFRIAAAL